MPWIINCAGLTVLRFFSAMKPKTESVNGNAKGMLTKFLFQQEMLWATCFLVTESNKCAVEENE